VVKFERHGDDVVIYKKFRKRAQKHLFGTSNAWPKKDDVTLILFRDARRKIFG
jgi:hypothetical protein